MSLNPSSAPAPQPLLFVVTRFRLVAVILLLAWPLTACTSWQSLPSPDPGFGSNVEHVTVRTPAGRELDVWYPQAHGDSLFGAATQARKGNIDVRLGNLQTLRIRRFSTGRTVILVVAVGLGVTVIVGAIVAASLGNMGFNFGGGSWGCDRCM